VLDVSAAMAVPVPAAGGLTRQQVAVQAAKGGLELFDPSWTVGLWVFSSNMDGDRDYSQLVPIGPVSEQKGQLASALDAVAPKVDGATGLYDTVLAAYKELRRGWDPGRGNTLVVITGGRNNDPNGLSLDALVTELRRNSSADQPTQIIFIGIGTDVSEPDLKKITAVTGGAVFVTQDPLKIGEIFVKALALMDR
jgi:Ca-activated chloride channel homolog